MRASTLLTVGFGGVVSALSLVPLLTSTHGSAPTSAIAHRPPPPGVRKAYDKPAEAVEFAVLKRTTGIETKVPGRRGPVPPVPTERYAAALAHIRNMPLYSTARNEKLPPGPQPIGTQALGTWAEIGPGNIGGRTRRLVFAPGNPNVAYLAAVAGGVWKTTDGGSTWNQLTDLLIPNIAVNSLVVDPSDANVLYAGTGEGYFNGDGVRGAGIFKSTNGGRTWTQLGSTAGPDFYYVNDIVISPRNSNRLYASTRTGVWRSNNGGNSWSRVLNAQPVLGCFDLAVQGTGAGYIFASCGTFISGAQSGIWRAEDGGGSGGSWTQVYTEPNIGRTTLAIAPSNPNIVYALAASTAPGTYQDGLLAVLRSNQSGGQGTWTTQVRNTDPNKVNTLLLSNPVYASLRDCGFGNQNIFLNQGWYDNIIEVDPVDPERVWAGGVDLFRSDDGGQTWGIASYWWFPSGATGGGADPNYAHADQHHIVFHPGYNGTSNRTMFVTSDGGIYRTTDARAAVGGSLANVCGVPVQGAVQWSGLNNGYAVTQFYHGTVYPDGETFFGGTQDNGTIRGGNATGNTWRELQGGDGGYVAVDPLNTQTLFAEFTGLSITRSLDGGASFTDATNGINNDPGFMFIAPFHMNGSDSQQLWTGGWYIWRTMNQGSSWQRASAITPGNGSVSAAAVSRVDPNRAVVGMSDGYLLFNHAATAANHTSSWAFSRPRAGFVSSVQWDPIDPAVVYATYSTFNTGAGQHHVYRSTDGGRTWTGIDGTGATALPDLPIHAVVVDPNNTSRLYVGSDAGVFTTLDGGASWNKEVTGYANVVTESLALNGTGTIRLYAFTHGRSAWRVGLVQ